MRPILICGSQGQLGTELLRLFPAAIGLSRVEFDVTHPESAGQILRRHQPEWIINCAAWTQVDAAETQPEAAFAVNSLGPGLLAKACREADCQLVHISTDFVFGREDLPQRPRRETDPAEPVSVYGISKLAGEHLVLAQCPNSLVVRSSGLYGSGGTGNFVRTMLKLGQAGRTLRVVNDQVCSPTSARDLAIGIRALMQQQASGLFHVANRGEISWYDWACKIFQYARIAVDVQPVSSAEYAAPAKRPAYSVLDCHKYEQLTGQPLPNLDSALQTFLESTERKATP